MSGDIAWAHAALRPHHHAILEAVHRAGEQLVTMQPSICQEKNAVKADGTIVTAADLASEEILLGAIGTYAPRPHWVISEEREPSPIADPAYPTWFVDPLDGTRAYAAGSPDFAILVSAWSGEQPEFSVVYYPSIGELAVATGRHATWTPPPVRDAAAGASPAGVMHACYMRSPALRQLAAEAGGAAYRENEVESTRALLDVATDLAIAAVVLLCGHKSWDLAPLLHLITATGGHVSDEAGNPVLMRGPDISGRYVVASRDQSLHQRLVAAAEKPATSEL